MKKWIINSTKTGKFTSKVIGWFPNEAKEQDIINYLHDNNIKINANDYIIDIEKNKTKYFTIEEYIKCFRKY